jgi:hypothetical protein
VQGSGAVRPTYPMRVAFYENGGPRDFGTLQCATRRDMARRAQGLADKHDTIVVIAEARTHLSLGWSAPRKWTQGEA